MSTSYSDIDEMMQDLVVCEQAGTIILYSTLLGAFLWWFITF